METRTLTGADLNRAVAMALRLKVYLIEHPNKPGKHWVLSNHGDVPHWLQSRPIPDYSGDISVAWPIIKEYLICFDAGDGGLKGEKKWAAWLACNAPLSAGEEVTSSDPLVAAMRALVYATFGDEINMENTYDQNN